MLNYAINDSSDCAKSFIEQQILISKQALDFNNTTNPYKINKVQQLDISELALTDFEKNIITNAQKTKIMFYPSNSFVMILPSHELYRNKFDCQDSFCQYLMELSTCFENITGFNIQHVDKNDDILNSWFASFEKEKNNLSIHGTTSKSSKPVDSSIKTNYDNFIKMIQVLIEISSSNTIKTVTFYN